MTYHEDVESILKSLTKEQRATLAERFEIDLYEPKQMLRSRHAFNDNLKRIREIERRALKKLNPNNNQPEPKGPKCTFCGITENEVRIMAKHESGFNICNECIELCMQVIQEENE
jgi:hypothetical protein